MVFMAFMVIVQTILTFLEITGAFWLVGCLLREKVTGWRKGVLAGAIVFAGVLTSYQRFLFLYSRWYLILCILFCIIVSCICFRKNKKTASLLICIYFETVYFLQLMIYIIGLFIFPDKDWIYEVQLKMGIEHLIIYVLADIIVALLLYIIRNHKIWISSILNKKTWRWSVIVILEHLSLYLCDPVMLPEHMQEGLSNARRILLLFPLLILVIVLIYMRQKYQATIDKQRDEIALYASRYDVAVKNDKRRMQLYHDMSHHITAVIGYLENEEYQEALAYLKMLYPVLQVEEKLKSSPVTFLLNEKIKDAKDNGIQVSAEYEEIWTDLNVEETRDWCALLGNLWDNAIEGNASVKEHPWIDFSVTRVGNAVKILIQNSCFSTQTASGGVPKTTKKEQDVHGMGFQIILNTVDKYHGDMEWYCENHVFCAKITVTL